MFQLAFCYLFFFFLHNFLLLLNRNIGEIQLFNGEDFILLISISLSTIFSNCMFTFEKGWLSLGFDLEFNLAAPVIRLGWDSLVLINGVAISTAADAWEWGPEKGEF
jgi:hypothetical protein